jgi:mannosyltransferase OCH1-like enzyme
MFLIKVVLSPLQLVATFVKFPHSHINVMSIPSNPNQQTPPSLSFNTTSSNALVPAIVHQVLLGDLQMRASWTEARSSCLKLHPTWDFKLWETREANAFVLRQYPQLYDIYQAYPLEIQRSNVLRYLLLHHYGGMYFDLDLACHQPLDFLRNETFITPPANPTGINNAFIVSSKGHPFWAHVIKNLPKYNVYWYTPYLTNMFSTGET